MECKGTLSEFLASGSDAWGCPKELGFGASGDPEDFCLYSSARLGPGGWPDLASGLLE